MSDVPHARQLEHRVERFPTADGGAHTTAVSDIDLAVPEGQLISVVGATGCGKSGVSRPGTAPVGVDVSPTCTDEYVAR